MKDKIKEWLDDFWVDPLFNIVNGLAFILVYGIASVCIYNTWVYIYSKLF
jgi:hypothetical protein